MRVQTFLSKNSIETAEDIELQSQMFAYLVAKHYGISLTEVLQMSPEIFNQSLSWALAIDSKNKKEQERASAQSNSGNETVTLDYTFLELEDF